MKYQGQTEIDFEITRQDSIINLVITGRAYFSSGVYYGENSFPDDYDSEIISAVDENGCKAIDTITLTVGRADIYIPNAFSPNNDGNNDVFKIYGNLDAIVMTQFVVFDRWGEEVFATNDAQSGWNGTYKGEPAPVGVYVYMITLNLADGSIKNYKGSVTLLK